MIRDGEPGDAPAICTIYNHYVRTSIVTFEETAVEPAEMARRIELGAARWPWLVHETGGALDGYAYATAWKPRSAYRHSVETTVYLAPHATGRGAGSRLYTSLLDRLRERGAHVALAGIALPNAASVALHEKLGFIKVGQLAAVGRKFERWIDVGYWQIRLGDDSRSG